MTFERKPSASSPGLLGEVSGAVADFGTFLPLVLGVLALGTVDASGVLTGFGLFAIAVAVFYRRPMPVQPMKAIAALAIVGALSPAEMVASGMIIGIVLLVLAASGLVDRVARMVPGTVIAGVQLGVGAQLAVIGFEHMIQDPALGFGAFALLAALFFTRFRALSCIVVFAAAAAVSFAAAPDQLAGVAPVFSLPALSFPVVEDFKSAALIAVLPQLALTFSNAVIATSAIAGDYFPEDRARLSPARLAGSTGVLNLVLAPLGAMPMCHGSGGLVAQYGFGARTWVAPAIFGTVCLVLGLAFGPGTMAILAVLPLSALGAMLAIAGAEMALGKRVRDARPVCRAIIIATGIGCVALNVAAGLVIGLALEGVRSAYNRSRNGERA
ncbi:MAG: putative sulfate/molybdate transporter [Rhodospirillales bacterium]|nr:putative sulfate/molybdate transporter [Rhodospirillales bacterium]MBO6788393.1 putative sulfate/molybdate transporter [Rhodospirillales bacterium]